MSRLGNIWEEDERILLYNSKQVAYPVGEKKDSYSICTYHYINGNAETITSRSEVRKNMFGKDEMLFRGTPHECYLFIKEIVDKSN